MATEGLRIWRDIDGDVLSLSTEDIRAPKGSSELELGLWCRALAQICGAGLIEACEMDTEIGPSVRLIYKRLQIPAYIYTGMLITSAPGVSLVWTIVAVERGATGVREAIVTANLMNAGELTIDDYRLHRAQDPYEPAYQGVDRSVLRFMSDHQSYDEQFPEHPLSKVRCLLATLPRTVQFDSQGL